MVYAQTARSLRLTRVLPWLCLGVSLPALVIGQTPISTPQDLIDLGSDPNNYSGSFILVNDIDMTGYSFAWAPIAPHNPDGTPGTPFTGVFDGDGHVISNLVVDDEGAGHNGLALFGTIDSCAQILDVGLENVSISATAPSPMSVVYYTGGLVAYVAGGCISRCYTTGSLQGRYFVGGLAGYSDGLIEDCYSSASVHTVSNSGAGLVARTHGRVRRCYSSGPVIDGDNGLIAYTPSYGTHEVSLCFWDSEACTAMGSDGGFARTTAQMMTASTYYGWGGGVWTIDEGNDYPRLVWENAVGTLVENIPTRSYGGNGSASIPFVLSSADDLVCMTGRMEDWDAHFTLAGDIDMSAVTDYLPPGGFTGDIDGAGHRILNLTIDKPKDSMLGVIGCLLGGGSVGRLGVTDMDINGYGDAGGLLGFCDGAVSQCFASGVIRGGETLDAGESTTDAYFGGLIGDCQGWVEDSYAAGAIVDDGSGAYVYAGGLIGHSSGHVVRCYSATTINLSGPRPGEGLIAYGEGGVALSFWDAEAATVARSAGGFARTTAQMSSASNYYGWGDGVWTIEEGIDYPRLAWENASGAIIEEIPPRLYGGVGTELLPYQITSAADLVCMTGRMEDWGDYFVLTNDIDMNLEPNYLPPGLFSGEIDGAGHVITNLHMDRSGDSLLGVIGYLDGGGIHDLHAHGVDIRGAGRVGGICGSNGGGQLLSCSATGNVEGVDGVGLLAGGTYHGTIFACFASGTATSESGTLGGLVGESFETDIEQCTAAAYLSGGGGGLAGGLVGWGVGGAIHDCYTSGSVSAMSGGTGGLIGASRDGTVSRCYAAADVVGMASHSGGLIGQDHGIDALTDCYFLDSAGPNNGLGTPLTAAEMKQQASFANWDFVGETQNGTDDIWDIYETLSYPYFSWQQFSAVDCNGNGVPDDLEIYQNLALDCNRNELPDSCDIASGASTDLDGNGVPDECDPDCNNNGQIDGLDIINGVSEDCNVNGVPDECDIDDGTSCDMNEDGVPDECNDPNAFYSGGSGTQLDPWLLASVADFLALTEDRCHLDRHFALANDIDLMGEPFTAAPIAPYDGITIRPFTGTLDGRGHAIRNLSVDGGQGNLVALIGVLAAPGEVRHLVLENAWLSGEVGVAGLVASNGTMALGGTEAAGDVMSCMVSGTVTATMWAGGLVGGNDGLISDCEADVTVNTSGGYAGGLVATNSTGTVERCRATGTVTGDEGVGGLVASNGGSVSNSYASGNVNGDEVAGGLVGTNAGSVSNSYASGNVIGDDTAGGLVGRCTGQVENSYSTGIVTGTIDLGGLLGEKSGGTITNGYYLDGSGPDNGLGVPLTVSEMQLQASFAGWDFAGDPNDGLDDVWRMAAFSPGYPLLWWEIRPDLDNDGDVDITDFDSFTFCMLGPDVARPGGCDYADSEPDGDADLADLAMLQRSFTGP